MFFIVQDFRRRVRDLGRVYQVFLVLAVLATLSGLGNCITAEWKIAAAQASLAVMTGWRPLQLLLRKPSGPRSSRSIGAALVIAVLAGLIQLVIVLGAPPAFACMCAPVSEAGHFRSADVVFAGTVVDARPSSAVIFDVTRAYRGDVREMVTVANPHGPLATADGLERVSSCDVGLTRATQWLVYAHDRDRGGLVIRPCTGTRPLPKKLPAVLGAGHRPMPIQFIPVVHERGPIPWLAAAGLGLLLLAVPGWWSLRMRRMRVSPTPGGRA